MTPTISLFFYHFRKKQPLFVETGKFCIHAFLIGGEISEYDPQLTTRNSRIQPAGSSLIWINPRELRNRFVLVRGELFFSRN